MAIIFKGKKYDGWHDLYHSTKPQPKVNLNTATGRLRTRTHRQGRITDKDIREILYLSPVEYGKRYRNRKTLIKIGDKEIILKDYYDEFENPSVKYSAFRQRVKGLESRDLLDWSSVSDAALMDHSSWISFYGGGRRRPFIYDGNLFPEYRGRLFTSIVSFLRLTDNYEKKATIWSRLKAGWSLDDSLTDPVVTLYDREGKIYIITNKNTKKQYIGLTTYSDISIRWRAHLREAFRGNCSTSLHKSIRRYGGKVFALDLLEEGIAQENLPGREKYWIDKLNTLAPNGLNDSSGGQMGGGKKKKIKYGEREFVSITEASAVLSKETGLAEHVIRRRLEADVKELPGKARQASKHPEAGSNLWRRWKAMLKKTKTKPNEICEEWLNYDKFKKDVTSSYSPELNLTRISKEKPWGVDNFQWASKQKIIEQTHGQVYLINGVKYFSLSSVSRSFGIGVSTLRDRTNRQKMTPEEAVLVKLGTTSYRTRKNPVEVDGIEFSSMNKAIKYAAKKYGITIHQAKDRLRRGVPLDKPNQARACKVSGYEFKSESSAARHFGVNKSTFGKRRKLGWDIEQALGLSPPPKKKK